MNIDTEHLKLLTNSPRRFSNLETDNWCREVIDELSIHAAADILDVGCGGGTLTAELGAIAPEGQVTGVDISANRIDDAVAHNETANVRFEHRDFFEVPPEKKFDLLTFFNSFHWLPDPGAALDQALSLLKPNGEILILTYSRGALRECVDAVRKSPRWATYFAEFHPKKALLTLNEYEHLLEPHPLKVVFARSKTHSSTFSSRSDATLSIGSWLEGVDLVPLAQRYAFLSDISTLYWQTHAVATLEFPVVELHLRKPLKA